jgi:hypothetical protein
MLEVDEHRDRPADAIEFIQVERQAGPSGDGGKVYDTVGRAADCLEYDHRVAK